MIFILRGLRWKYPLEKLFIFFSQAYLSLLLLLSLFINQKLYWSGDYVLNHVWAVLALLLRKAAAIKLLVNLSIDTLHVPLQKKSRLNFNLLGTQLTTWPPWGKGFKPVRNFPEMNSAITLQRIIHVLEGKPLWSRQWSLRSIPGSCGCESCSWEPNYHLVLLLQWLPCSHKGE